MSDYAQAGAFRNNCALHCVAHTLFNFLDQLRPNERKHYLEQNQFFKTILKQFTQRYGFNENNFSWDDIFEINARFPNPYDRELLWGPVLRDALPFLKPDNGSFQNRVKLYKELEDQDIAELLEALGGGFCISIPVDDKQNYITMLSMAGAKEKIELLGIIESIYADPDEIKDIMKQSNNFSEKEINTFMAKQKSHNLWHCKLYHTIRGGGHWDFSYSDLKLDKAHNQQIAIDAQNRVIPKDKKSSKLYHCTEIVGVENIDKKIKEIVQENHLSSEVRSFCKEIDDTTNNFKINPVIAEAFRENVIKIHIHNTNKTLLKNALETFNIAALNFMDKKNEANLCRILNSFVEDETKKIPRSHHELAQKHNKQTPRKN